MGGYATALHEDMSTAQLESLEDDLFRFGRIVASTSPLRAALTDRDLDAAARQGLVAELLAGKAPATTLALVRYVVTGGRARDFVGTVDFLVEQTAAARGWRIAHVRAAAPIDDAQQVTLSESLSRLAGGPVELQVVIDESLLSGARVRIGDLLVDATARGRIDALREHLVPGRVGADGVRPRRSRPRDDRRHRGSRLMAELTIDASEITKALERYVEDYTPAVGTEQIGHIVEVGDGIARVSGLPGAAVNELLEFEDGTLGLALNLDEDTIGAVVLGEVDNLEEEQIVKATGRIQTVPVGDALLGRVVNALGEPLDGKGPVNTTETRRMEVQAPGIVGRQPVSEPLQTGIKAIDAMTPIGRGQRELIIGDRKTGKTTVAVDTIINQAGQGVKCIYVAIGQKNSSVAQTVATLEDHQALEYTVVVVASAGDPAPYKYLAPYAGCAMGQHWMENGEHALIIYDDLSKQAEAYRAVSLLLRRPPGREAYPGDVFYLHSRLLGAGGQAVRRTRRRIAHRAAGHRDEGGRHLGLHPDQRDLHHRRAGLPRDRPVQLGHPPGHQRRQLGQPGGQRSPGQGHEASVGDAQARPGAVPRARGVRHLRLGARQGVAGPARPGLPADRAAQAAAEPAGAGRGAGVRDLRRHQGLDGLGPGQRGAAVRDRAHRVLQGQPPGRARDDPHHGCAARRGRARQGSDLLPRGIRHGEGRLTHGRRPRADPAPPDPQRAVHEEDHQGDGAHRRLADRARPEPDRGQPPLPRGHGAGAAAGGGGRPDRGRQKLLGTPESPRHVGILAIAGDRGLAGSYNSGVLRATERLVAEHRAAGPR